MLLAALLVTTPAAALEDPTRPPGYGVSQPQATVPASPRWRLQSTLIAPGRRLANINGKMLRPGEHVNGAQLIEIQAAHVILRHNGTRITLSLLPQDFKRIHGAR
jgi:hypothetical protein